MIELDTGTAVAIAAAIVGAWWGIARLMFAQFERRQDEKFDTLTDSVKSIDAHTANAMIEIRRVESELARAQVEASRIYQTKVEANNQHAQIINEIRAVGLRIDALHVKGIQQ